MKLKELLKVVDDFTFITIHRNGQRNIHCYAGYVNHDLFDYEVMEVSGSYRSETGSGLLVWVEDPADLYNPDDLNPPFPSEVCHIDIMLIALMILIGILLVLAIVLLTLLIISVLIDIEEATDDSFTIGSLLSDFEEASDYD